MKLGLSSYSFRPLMQDGSMSIEQVFDWIKVKGGEHLELATLSVAAAGADMDYDLGQDSEMLARLQSASATSGIPISGICLPANFTGDARSAQVEKVKRYIELCDRLGVRFLRHDVVAWSLRSDTATFEQEFAGIADACGEVGRHAEKYGVVASVEDHGFFMNSSERVRRLLHAVNLPSFRMTLDVGNFLCVDEDPLTATRACLPLASMVHFKDFYVRRTAPGPGWLDTVGGQAIRGSVFGYGDMPVKEIVEAVVASGYDGFVSLEYEGNEPTGFGCETGLITMRKLIDAARPQ